MIKCEEFIDDIEIKSGVLKIQKTLDEQLNEFFTEHPEIEIIDIKYSVTPILVSDYIIQGGYKQLVPRSQALVVYKEKI